jgi:hypothetical protein
MPKNRLFKLLNYFSKNYSFYFFKYLSFHNASPQLHLDLEIILSNFFKHAEETKAIVPIPTIIIFSGFIF